ncbi:MAG: TniQ family protein [Methylacidiphilales bacterium]|nr:TniQ family protein [Candidatus Methylacidiphilales bacterium]
METNINTTYNLWDLSIPNVLERSTLFHLEPIGIATPDVESLTSYVKRLANAHSISPRMLILSEIAPLLGVEYVLGEHNKSLEKIYAQRTYALNSVGKMALSLVNALELKTLCSNLRFLTMLTWQNVINQRSLMRSHQAWCPFCYQEWDENKQIIYEPLYWSFKAINICIKHHKTLFRNCPHCKQSQVHLSGQAQSGYCSKCRGWLGDIPNNLTIDDMTLPIEQLNWQNFVADNIVKLIALAPCLKTIPSTNAIQENLLAFIENTPHKNLKYFAFFSSIPYKLLYNYTHNPKSIVLDKVLYISYQLGISLIDFFTKEPAKNLTSLCIRNSQTASINSENKQSKKYFKHSQILEAEYIVNDALQEFPPPSIYEVATRIGCYFTTIKANFPELYSLLQIRYDCYKNKGLKDKLEATLHEESPRSMLQISKSLGFKSSDRLYREFPDICYQISSRYQNYIDQIVQSKCQEVRNAAIKVHESGKEPNSGNIAVFLAHPGIRRNPYAQAELAKVKHELGYK